MHRAPGGLADAIDLGSYTTELYDDAVLQWVYAREPADGFDPALLPDRFRDPGGRRVFALWWFVFPNLTLNFYPWGLSVNVYQPVPDRPDATRFVWYQWVIDPARTPSATTAGCRRRSTPRTSTPWPRSAAACARASRRAVGSRPATSRPRTGSTARSRATSSPDSYSVSSIFEA